MKNDYRQTLNIFTVDFPLQPRHEEDVQTVRKIWKKTDTLQHFFTKNSTTEPEFILHDGPPYANGPTHVGGAYNNILKDIIVKSKKLLGCSVHCIPGWDCHGLPIEQKVTKDIFNKNDRKNVIQECRKFATKWIEAQEETLQKLGIFMEWWKPYLTMNYSYEADIVRSLAVLTEKGYIYRAKKTIPWCCNCKTALASAEIEYIERKDPSLYLTFTIKNSKELFDIENVCALVWTTTPWTLPLNRAIAVKNGGEYLLIKSRCKYIIVGAARVNDLFLAHDIEHEVIKIIPTTLLQKALFIHPFDASRMVPCIIEEQIDDKEGTACVHIAPGCGPIDYEYGIKHNLEIFSPIDNEGNFTDEVGIKELIGKKYSEIYEYVIEKLKDINALWHLGTIKHSYPHCWRSKTPLMFRATSQWFFNLRHNNIKEKILKAIETIEFFPPTSKSFLRASVENRWEWCLSRQRVWGPPIPALIDKETDEAYINPAMMKKVAEKIAIHGIEWWTDATIESLIKEDIVSDPQIIDTITNFIKEDDILDVWFDSGVSHSAVLKKNDQFPADIYVEGVDQHRGWFQSSLITSIALYEHAPMKKIISHGYVVDKNKMKMSKSIGNVLYPEDIVKKYGTDIFRCWVGMIGSGDGGDVALSEKILENASEIYRKTRNTCRFILQNIVDFDISEAKNGEFSFSALDMAILRENFVFQTSVLDAYQKNDIPMALTTINEYVNNTLSNIYFDCIKDTLYCCAPKAKERIGVQGTLVIILDTLVSLINPIMTYAAELIYQEYRGKKSNISLFMENLLLFNDFPSIQKYYYKNLDNFSNLLEIGKEWKIKEKNLLIWWEKVSSLRNCINEQIESTLRITKIVKQNSEVDVVVHISESYFLDKDLLTTKTILQKICQVASLTIISDNSLTEKNQIIVKSKKTDGSKCERCWGYFIKKDDELCERCAIALQQYSKTVS